MTDDDRPEPRTHLHHEPHDPHRTFSHLTGAHAFLPDPHVAVQSLPPEPSTRRIHQYGLMIGLAVLVVVCTVWLSWQYATKNREANQNAAAAHRLCRQVSNLGQSCATHASGGETGVSGDAQVPATSLTGEPIVPSRGTSPVPTDEEGVPLPFQPGEDALIVAVNVSDGRLVITFDDGARIDAGPVNEEVLAIVLKNLPTPSFAPSPTPAPDSPSPSSAGPPAPTVTPEESPT